MTLILFIVGLAAAVALGFWFSWRLIGGEPGRHAGHESFDWEFDVRPHFGAGRPDRLEQLIAQFYLPDKALEELLDTDRAIAAADAILRPA